MNKWNISIDDLLPKERVLILNKFTQKDNTAEISKQAVYGHMKPTIHLYGHWI